MRFRVIFYAVVVYTCLYMVAFVIDSMHGRDVYYSLSRGVRIFLASFLVVNIVVAIIMAIIVPRNQFASPDSM